MSNFEFVPGDKIDRSKGIVLNMEDMINDVEANTTPTLPDVPKMLDDIATILEYMNTPDIRTMKQNSPYEEYKAHMEQKFGAFSFRYIAIFEKLISGEDITPLFEMLVEIEKVKSGQKDLQEAEKYLGEKLAERYVPNYSKMSGKKKKNKH